MMITFQRFVVRSGYILTFLLLLASSSLAGWYATPRTNGWTTSVWPAWQHPRDVQTQLADCFWALQERRAAFRNTTNWPGLDATVWATNDWRKFRVNLDILRAATADLWDGSVGVVDAGAIGLDGTLNDYFGTNQGVWATIPTVSARTNLMRLRIPTNYFAVAQGPFRCELSGLGGNTQEIGTIGHAHGWTNSVTMLGGPDLPAGRTNWYTTDYGLDNLKAILQSVRYTPDNWVDHVDTSNTISYRNAGGDHAATWATAKAWAEENEVEEDEYTLSIGTRGYKYSTPDYLATWCGASWAYRVYSIGIASNVNKSYSVYQFAEPMDADYSSAGWHDQGFSVLSNQYAEFWTTNLGTSRGITSPVMGKLSFPGLEWCAEPTYGNPTSAGFSIGGGEWAHGLIKWTFNYQ